MTILYKKNNRNNISWWAISQDGNTYTITWGQDHQTQTTNNNFTKHTCDTPERAEFEVQSRIDRQLDRLGYSKEVPDEKPDLPMLAQEWSKHIDLVLAGKREDFKRVAIQPKLDGMRAIASHQGLLTRRRTNIYSVPHIEHIINQLPPGVKLDGELYIENTPLQIIMSIVKRNRAHRLHKTVKYYVFDLIDENKPFVDRYDELREHIDILRQEFNNYAEHMLDVPVKLRPEQFGTIDDFPIEIVPTLNMEYASCSSQVQHFLKQRFDEYVAAGYEGCIVRNLDAKYQINKRSPDLLKYKESQDHEFEIIDVLRAHDDCGVFVCKTHDGKIFDVNPAWSKPAKQLLLQRREYYIGRWLHVEYEKLSLDGIPLKPIGKLTMDEPSIYK